MVGSSLASLASLAVSHERRGDEATAVRLLEERLELVRAPNATAEAHANTCGLLSIHRLSAGRVDEARALVAEALHAIRREPHIAQRLRIVYTLFAEVELAVAASRLALARRYARQQLFVGRRLDHAGAMADALWTMGAVAARQDRLLEAAWLVGAGEATAMPAQRLDPRRPTGAELARVGDALGNERFEAAVAVGRALSLEQAIELALSLSL